MCEETICGEFYILYWPLIYEEPVCGESTHGKLIYEEPILYM
jgi:hypothetical protein